jgi:hypothetical protein
MIPTMQIRVLNPPTVKEQLESAVTYLTPFGSASMAVDFTTLQLVFDMPPVNTFTGTDGGRVTMFYDQQGKKWKCESTLYGIHIVMEQPKLFWSNVLSMTEDLLNGIVQFVQKVQEFWQRYTGDPNMFMYRLSVDLGSNGVGQYDREAPNGVFGEWTNTLDTKFKVWFSIKPGQIKPSYWLGFYPEAATRFADAFACSTPSFVKETPGGTPW